MDTSNDLPDEFDLIVVGTGNSYCVNDKELLDQLLPSYLY